jgi:hypothetical protein
VNKRVFGFVAALVAVVSLILVGCAEPASSTERLSYGCPSATTSSWYPEHCKNAELGGLGTGKPVTVVLPGGGVAVTQAVFDGEVDTGGSTVPALYEMIHGLANWEGEPQPNRLRVLYVHTDCPHPITVPADSGIDNVMDLTGKKIYLGNPGSTTYSQHELAFDALGLEYEAFVGDQADAVIAFKDGRLDVYIKATNGHSLDASQIDIMSTRDISLIGWTDDQMLKIKEEYPWVGFREFPAGWYDAFPELGAINEIAYALPVIARDDFPEELAYQWTKSVIENFDELGALLPGAAAYDPLDTPNVLPPDVFMHPGAIRYFREIGVEIPDSVVPPEMK